MQLALHTLNSSRSAYHSITFKPEFFDVYTISCNQVQCSVLLKAVCSVLRTPLASIDHLSIRLPDPDASKMQWTLECYSGMKKSYWIICNVEPDIQHLSLDRRRFPSSLVVRPRDLNRLLANFQSSLQEITIIATEPTSMPSDVASEIGGKAVELRSYIDPTKDSDSSLHTQLWIDPAEEFVQYTHTGDPIDVTFGVKELKAFLSFCEGCEVDIHLYFEKAGEPILMAPKFGLDDGSTSNFDATLVLATMLVSHSNAAKKINDMKVNMAYLEWYKKESKDREIGYYDVYKNKHNRADFNVQEFKKKLSNYWQDLVEEVENRPQKEGAALRTRWLMGGTNYRRMMEPLHIAEYYKDKDGKNYIEERPKHFILLEKWFEEEEERKVAERIRRGETVEDGPSKSKAQNVASSLTDDSCFWAHVEEALILCNQLEKGQPSFQEREQCKQKLIEFEKYVLDALKNFAVTPDIFLKYSSFMAWWKQYNKIVRSSTQLGRIMTDGTYRHYEKGVKVVFEPL